MLRRSGAPSAFPPLELDHLSFARSLESPTFGEWRMIHLVRILATNPIEGTIGRKEGKTSFIIMYALASLAHSAIHQTCSRSLSVASMSSCSHLCYALPPSVSHIFILHYFAYTGDKYQVHPIPVSKSVTQCCVRNVTACVPLVVYRRHHSSGSNRYVSESSGNKGMKARCHFRPSVSLTAQSHRAI